MIASVVNQLVTALKTDAIGYQFHVDAVATKYSITLPTVPDSHIYGPDSPVDIKKVNLPALVITPVDTDAAEVRSQGKRDSVHTIAFEYATQEVDTSEWRNEAMYMAEALMRFLDLFNSCNTDYIGSSGAIVVQSWRCDYTVTWQSKPNEIRGFVLEADIFARDTF